MSELDKAMTDIQNQAANLQGSYSEERDVVNQMLGQVQMANSIARFADVVSLTKLAHIKETRMYKALAGKKGVDPQGNEIADIGTFDGFCRALGLSRSKVDEDLTNLKHFGEEALNNLTAIGIGYREMRQFRKLPTDQKEALISVAKEGDKDSFLELAEDIIAKHAKEKEALETQLSGARADYEAQSEVLNKKSMELTETRLELEKTRRRIQSMPESEAINEVRNEIKLCSQSGLSSLVQLKEGFNLLNEMGENTGSDQRAYMAGELTKLELMIDSLREEFALPKGGELGAEDYLDDSLLEEVMGEFSNKDEEQFDYIEGAFIPTQEGGDNEDESGRH